MNRETLARTPMDKTVNLVIVGKPLQPERAVEIIRRTDSIFFVPDRFVSAYGRNVRRMLGYPQDDAIARRTPQKLGATWDLDTEAERFREKWGFINLYWLTNAQVLRADGWCHPDGAVYLAEDSGRYPLATDYYDDCLALARVFPDLYMDVAVWGPWNLIPTMDIHDAPAGPWSIELRQSLQPPSFGLLVRNGEVRVIKGFNSPLFADYGMDFHYAAEIALDQWRRRRAAGPMETSFGDRAHHCGIGDDVVRGWIETSRALGIVGQDAVGGPRAGPV